MVGAFYSTINQVKFKIPPLAKSYNITVGMVDTIHKKKGDIVQINDEVMVIETAKVVIHETAPVAGVIESINVKKDDDVFENTVIYSIKNI